MNSQQRLFRTIVRSYCGFDDEDWRLAMLMNMAMIYQGALSKIRDTF